MLRIEVNACVTAKEFDWVLWNNGKKLGEYEGINSIFVDFWCIGIEIEQFFSNKSYSLSVSGK